jgi:hypothetical protein
MNRLNLQGEIREPVYFVASESIPAAPVIFRSQSRLPELIGADLQIQRKKQHRL